MLVASLPTPAQGAVLAALGVALFAILVWRFFGRPRPPRLSPTKLFACAAIAAITWSLVLLLAATTAGASGIEDVAFGGFTKEFWKQLEASVWVSLWLGGLLLIGLFLFVSRSMSSHSYPVRPT